MTTDSLQLVEEAKPWVDSLLEDVGSANIRNPLWEGYLEVLYYGAPFVWAALKDLDYFQGSDKKRLTKHIVLNVPAFYDDYEAPGAAFEPGGTSVDLFPMGILPLMNPFKVFGKSASAAVRASRGARAAARTAKTPKGITRARTEDLKGEIVQAEREGLRKVNIMNLSDKEESAILRDWQVAMHQEPPKSVPIQIDPPPSAKAPINLQDALENGLVGASTYFLNTLYAVRSATSATNVVDTATGLLTPQTYHAPITKHEGFPHYSNVNFSDFRKMINEMQKREDNFFYQSAFILESLLSLLQAGHYIGGFRSLPWSQDIEAFRLYFFYSLQKALAEPDDIYINSYPNGYYWMIQNEFEKFPGGYNTWITFLQTMQVIPRIIKKSQGEITTLFNYHDFVDTSGVVRRRDNSPDNQDELMPSTKTNLTYDRRLSHSTLHIQQQLNFMNKLVIEKKFDDNPSPPEQFLHHLSDLIPWIWYYVYKQKTPAQLYASYPLLSSSENVKPYYIMGVRYSPGGPRYYLFPIIQNLNSYHQAAQVESVWAVYNSLIRIIAEYRPMTRYTNFDFLDLIAFVNYYLKPMSYIMGIPNLKRSFENAFITRFTGEGLNKFYLDLNITFVTPKDIDKVVGIHQVPITLETISHVTTDNTITSILSNVKFNGITPYTEEYISTHRDEVLSFINENTLWVYTNIPEDKVNRILDIINRGPPPITRPPVKTPGVRAQRTIENNNPPPPPPPPPPPTNPNPPVINIAINQGGAGPGDGGKKPIEGGGICKSKLVSCNELILTQELKTKTASSPMKTQCYWTRYPKIGYRTYLS